MSATAAPQPEFNWIANDVDSSLQVLEVRTPDVTVRFLPGLGGRLLSIETSAGEWLWRDRKYIDNDFRPVVTRSQWRELDGTMASWANVGGSKTWPAPQGWERADQWHGPPDPILDSGEWSCAVTRATDALTVEMISGHDPRSGLTVTRRFDIPASGFEFRQSNRFQNSSANSVTWAIWEVAQLSTLPQPGDRRGTVSVHHLPGSQLLALIGDEPRGTQTASDTRLTTRTDIEVHDAVLKLGFTKAHAMSYRRPDRRGLRIETTLVENANYPDGGCSAELWMQYPVEVPIASLGDLKPTAHLVELELLGPSTTLDPGDSTVLDITWRLDLA